MGKRGRKRTGYFYEEQENAVVEYIVNPDKGVRDRLFNQILLPAFTKMIESIIRRYKLYVPDEEFDQTFDDTISFLMTKIHKYKKIVYKYDEMDSKKITNDIQFVVKDEKFFLNNYKDMSFENPDYIEVTFEPSTYDKLKSGFNEKNGESLTRFFKKTEYHYKAYSYCGTICKNYLYYKLNQFKKHQEKQESYDDMYEVIRENGKYSVPEFGEESPEEFLTNLITNTCSEIRRIIGQKEDIQLTPDEERVGLALLDLFENWDELFRDVESNKMGKSLILLYIKESTQLSTTEIRKSMKKYKTAYFDMKKVMLEN